MTVAPNVAVQSAGEIAGIPADCLGTVCQFFSLIVLGKLEITYTCGCLADDVGLEFTVQMGDLRSRWGATCTG